MTVESPKELADKLINSGCVQPNSFVGCSESEIAFLESHFAVRLPAYYKDILRTMGKDDGNWMSECTWTLKCLTGITRRDAERYSATHKFQLEPTWFVFMSDDSCFFFFDTLAGNDPPVMRWCDDQGFKKVFESLSSWFKDLVDGSVESWQELQLLNAKLAERDLKR